MVRSFSCLLALVLSSLVAHALAFPALCSAEPQLVGILSIETRGVSDVVAGQFEAEVEEALDGVGVQSVGRDALRKKLEGSVFMEGCLFGPCLNTLRNATGIPIVLVANIQGNGSSYNFVISLIDTRTGSPTSQVSQNCAVCTIEEAISTATLTTISLLMGTGDTKTSADVTLLQQAASGKRVASSKRLLRRSGLVFLGVGAVAVLSGVYLMSSRGSDVGIVATSSGASIAAGGVTMLLLSRRF